MGHGGCISLKRVNSIFLYISCVHTAYICVWFNSLHEYTVFISDWWELKECWFCVYIFNQYFYHVYKEKFKLTNCLKKNIGSMWTYALTWNIFGCILFFLKNWRNRGSCLFQVIVCSQKAQKPLYGVSRGYLLLYVHIQKSKIKAEISALSCGRFCIYSMDERQQVNVLWNGIKPFWNLVWI